MTPSRTTLADTVLLVDDQEWTSRSVESILRPKGFAVLKAYTGRQALDLASKVSPDVIIVDFHLPDLDGIDVVRELRSRKILDPVTPLLMMSSSVVGRAERLEALGAGAWEILRHPLDPGELILRMENFVRAKHEADRLRHELMTDPGTGFYNVRGVLRRAREMGADSVRFGRPMACIAVGPAWADDGPESVIHGAESLALPAEFSGAVAQALRGILRESDAVGKLGPGEFVIVVPGVDGEGAAVLADRILAKVGLWTPTPTDPGQVRLRAGVYVPHDERSVDPENLLSKATMALRRAQAGGGSDMPIRTFDA
jgi:PleD family two-component response regulator